MRMMSLPEEILHTEEETVILDDTNSVSQGFNEEYEELQKNLVFTPSNTVLWFQCDICNRKSATKERLAIHIDKKHGEQTSGSVIDNSMPYNNVISNDDNLSNLSQDKFKCSVCPFSCNTNADLMRHSKKHEGIKPYQCELCGKSFSQKGNLRPHMLRHSGVKPYECPVCFKAFNHKTSYNKHVAEHTFPKKIDCRFCPENTFATTLERNNHEKKNHYGDDVDCVICGVILNSSLGLRMHVSQMHPDFYHKTNATIEKKYQCTFCPKKFSTKTYLAIHHKIHTGEKPFKCNVHDCNYAAVSKDSLKKHTDRAHGKMKLLSCNLCDKKFSYYSHKKAHLLKHYNLKPFKCDICERAFFSRRHLNDHMRMHEGNAKYKCHKCNVAYILPDSLRKHVDQHLNSPMECHICKELFWVTGKYNKHMLKHRREFDGKECVRPYKCTKCNKGFKAMRFLERHTSQNCCDTETMECTECDKILPSNKALRRHLKMDHNLNEHSCFICTESFKRIQLLIDHLETVHSYQIDKETPIKNMYSESKFKFAAESVGKITLETVEDVEPQSSVLIIDANNLVPELSVVKSEPSEVTYECSDCQQICNTYIDLITHRETYHDYGNNNEEISESTITLSEDNVSKNSTNDVCMEEIGKPLKKNSAIKVEQECLVLPREEYVDELNDLSGAMFECTYCSLRFDNYTIYENHYLTKHIRSG